MLPWTLYKYLLPIKDEKIRLWYVNEIRTCSWSKNQLIRNIKTDYYHRVLSNQIVTDKNNKSMIFTQSNYLKSIYIFDFLKKQSNKNFKESELEQMLIANLKTFMLELGKGYTFKASQLQLRTNNNDYYIDLVFYNEILRCNILIDLKIEKIKHKDIGQMKLYLKIFDDMIKQPIDNPSIGIILSSEINQDIVKYIMLDKENHIVASKYLTYLPTKEQLRKEIEKVRLALSKK